MNLSIDIARKVLAIVDAGLVAGLGVPVPGQLCVEAAVCLALGEPHGDRPKCVAEPDRRFKIALNDARWASDAARARGLRRLSVMQLGTAGTDREPWLRLLTELTIRRVVPAALGFAATCNPKSASALRAAGKLCAEEGTREAARAAASAASAAADAAARAADTYDTVLTISAQCAEEAYLRTGSPGVDLLRGLGLARDAEARKP